MFTGSQLLMLHFLSFLFDTPKRTHCSVVNLLQFDVYFIEHCHYLKFPNWFKYNNQLKKFKRLNDHVRKFVLVTHMPGEN